VSWSYLYYSRDDREGGIVGRGRFFLAREPFIVLFLLRPASPPLASPGRGPISQRRATRAARLSARMQRPAGGGTRVTRVGATNQQKRLLCGYQVAQWPCA
jgi:hypothetical protein